MFQIVIKRSNMWLYQMTGSENILDTKIFYKNLGQNIRLLRKKKGLTQEQFGEIFGLTKSAIVNYEIGIRKIPIDVLYQIAMFHNVTIDSLICKKKTIADILKNEIGETQLNDKAEDVLVAFINYLKEGK